jgi:hypothetical protein
LTFREKTWPASLTHSSEFPAAGSRALGLERPVHCAGRPAGIGARDERLATITLGIVADGQVALDQVHLFPVIVHERRLREDPGSEAQ